MEELKKNWKTSLIGLAVAAFNLMANGTKPAQVMVSVGFLALGMLAKDFNVQAQ